MIQAPGGAIEDPTKGFKFGGWAMPYFDRDFGEELDRVFKEFKDIEKYAVSRSGEVDMSWAGSVLLRDSADVKRLKQEDGPNLVTQG
jgi:hypothetical protein